MYLQKKLNRSLENFFMEIKQAVFAPSTLVLGIYSSKFSWSANSKLNKIY